MSDWKTRAIRVDADTNDWKSRATNISEAPDVGITESALRGIAQGATFGFADEITGGTEAIWDSLTKDQKQSFLDLYKQHRDESRAAFEAAKEANPGTYFVGEVGGAVLPGLITAGVGTEVSLANMARVGAMQGTVAALGSSNADNAADMVEDMGKGAAFGAAGGAAGYGLSKLIKGPSTDSIKKFAESQAVKATGATGKQAAAFDPKTGRTLLDKGVVGFGDSQDQIADKAAAALEQEGQKIGKVIQQVSEQNKVKMEALNAQKQALQKLIQNEESKVIGAKAVEQSIPERLPVSGGSEIALVQKAQMRPKAPTLEPNWESGGNEFVGDLTDVFGRAGNSEGNWFSDLLAHGKMPEPTIESIPTLPAGISSEKYLATLKDQLSAIELQITNSPGSKERILASLRSKVNQLTGDPSQAKVVRELNGIIEDITQTGPRNPTMSEVEATKRGYQSMVNWANPEGNAAKSTAADVYKQVGEEIAAASNPEAAAEFLKSKSLYSQLQPVAEAAERRAATTAQSPTGGLGDMVSYGVGGFKGVIAKKFIMPRVNSTVAVTADKLADLITSRPEVFGKFGPVLQSAAQRGGVALGATIFILQQNDPEFRQTMQQVQGQ